MQNAEAESVLFFLEKDFFSFLGGSLAPSKVLVVMVKVFLLPPSDDDGETFTPSYKFVETVTVLTCSRGTETGDDASVIMSS
jgi:hypothetical protein